MTLTTRTLPAYWASYLINNDPSGIDEIDRKQADAFLAREKLPMPADCSDHSWEQWSNDAHSIPMGGLVMQFIFLIP